jgi:hypothetical protein
MLRGFGDAPDSKIAVSRLSSEHVCLLFGRGTMPRKASNARRRSGGRQCVQYREGRFECCNENGTIEVSFGVSVADQKSA